MSPRSAPLRPSGRLLRLSFPFVTPNPEFATVPIVSFSDPSAFGVPLVLRVSRRLLSSVSEITLYGRKSIRRLCPSVQRSRSSPAVCSRFPPQFPVQMLMCLRPPVSQKVL